MKTFYVKNEELNNHTWSKIKKFPVKMYLKVHFHGFFLYTVSSMAKEHISASD
jgi:hypothetical protein